MTEQKQAPAPAGVDETTGEVISPAGGQVVRLSSAQVVAQFTDLVTSIPEAPEDDGMGMILRIMEVETWEDLLTQSKLPSSLDLIGQKLYVTAVWRKPSDQPTATGFYLLCEAQDRQSGKVWNFTAGGTQTVAVLAKLHTLNALPAMIQFEKAETRSGRTAVNCTVLDTYNGNAR